MITRAKSKPAFSASSGGMDVQLIPRFETFPEGASVEIKH